MPNWIMNSRRVKTFELLVPWAGKGGQERVRRIGKTLHKRAKRIKKTDK